MDMDLLYMIQKLHVPDAVNTYENEVKIFCRLQKEL